MLAAGPGDQCDVGLLVESGGAFTGLAGAGGVVGPPTLGLPGWFPGQRGARVVGQWSLRLSPVGHLVPVGGGGIGRVSSSDDPMNAMVCSLMMMVGTGLSGPPGPSARR